MGTSKQSQARQGIELRYFIFPAWLVKVLWYFFDGTKVQAIVEILLGVFSTRIFHA